MSVLARTRSRADEGAEVQPSDAVLRDPFSCMPAPSKEANGKPVPSKDDALDNHMRRLFRRLTANRLYTDDLYEVKAARDRHVRDMYAIAAITCTALLPAKGTQGVSENGKGADATSAETSEGPALKRADAANEGERPAEADVGEQKWFSAEDENASVAVSNGEAAELAAQVEALAMRLARSHDRVLHAALENMQAALQEDVCGVGGSGQRSRRLRVLQQLRQALVQRREHLDDLRKVCEQRMAALCQDLQLPQATAESMLQRIESGRLVHFHATSRSLCDVLELPQPAGELPPLVAARRRLSQQAHVQELELAGRQLARLQPQLLAAWEAQWHSAWNRTVACLVQVQAWVRMARVRRHFAVLRTATRIIQAHWRGRRAAAAAAAAAAEADKRRLYRRLSRLLEECGRAPASGAASASPVSERGPAPDAAAALEADAKAQSARRWSGALRGLLLRGKPSPGGGGGGGGKRWLGLLGWSASPEKASGSLARFAALGRQQAAEGRGTAEARRPRVLGPAAAPIPEASTLADAGGLAAAPAPLAHSHSLPVASPGPAESGRSPPRRATAPAVASGRGVHVSNLIIQALALQPRGRYRSLPPHAPRSATGLLLPLPVLRAPQPGSK